MSSTDSSLLSSPSTLLSRPTRNVPADAEQGDDGKRLQQVQLIQKRIETILAQDRREENFGHYTSSDKHAKRIQQLAQIAPELYDNPSITPRQKWFGHARYYDNSQMPPFHIHFRCELQSVIKSLWRAWQHLLGHEYDDDDKNNTRKVLHGHVQRAQRTFQSCMRGLHGHVRIEEYACFPLYKQTCPALADIVATLEKDHHELHQAEQGVHEALVDAVATLDKNLPLEDGDTAIKNRLAKTLQTVLDFDDVLMAHLGEEEEIVVPMSLTDKPIWF